MIFFVFFVNIFLLYSSVTANYDVNACPLHYFPVADICVRLNFTKSIWIDAMEECQKDGATLLSLTTKTRLSGLTQFFKQHGHKGAYWTSGATINHHWFWTGEGKSIEGFQWGWWRLNRALSRRCAYFSCLSKSLAPKACYRYKYFVCQKEKAAVNHCS
ncbi:UNVERIFIED_CONTAM: hypothetical protein RMT77_010017 [Armadillidium vulgare]